MGKPRVHQSILEVTEDGEIKMYNKQDYIRFLGLYPGRRFIMETKVIETGEKAWLRGYYFAEPVQAFMRGWEGMGEYYDKMEAHHKMKLLFPKMRIYKEQEDPKKKPKVDTRSIMDESFTTADFWEYIEFLKQYAAEHFGIYIYDPREQRS